MATTGAGFDVGSGQVFNASRNSAFRRDPSARCQKRTDLSAHQIPSPQPGALTCPFDVVVESSFPDIESPPTPENEKPPFCTVRVIGVVTGAASLPHERLTNALFWMVKCMSVR